MLNDQKSKDEYGRFDRNWNEAWHDDGRWIGLRKCSIYHIILLGGNGMHIFKGCGKSRIGFLISCSVLGKYEALYLELDPLRRKARVRLPLFPQNRSDEPT